MCFYHSTERDDVDRSGPLIFTEHCSSARTLIIIIILIFLLLYLGFFASAIHSRSMLHARTGMWGYRMELQGLSGLPLVRRTSTISWRLVSHLIGSPNKMTAVRTNGQRRKSYNWKTFLLIYWKIICLETYRLLAVILWWVESVRHDAQLSKVSCSSFGYSNIIYLH